MTERVTVKPGDYVAIKDIETPEQATAIADAFIAAGATPGAGYPYADDNDACWDNLFWDKSGNATNRGSGGERRLAPRQIIGEPVTLAPGDYVSTAGMTEDQYHAVARAFMAAGAAGGEYPNYSYADKEISRARWSFGNRRGALWHGLSGCFDGRHLTPAQVIGAVNAGNQQEKDNMEHKAGDRFIATKASRFFSEGSIVRFTGEYGCFGNPKMELVSGECSLNNGSGGTPGAIETFDRFRKVDHEEKQDMLTALLEAAETARENADQHQMLADQASGEHDRLMQQARDMLPDGWRLVRDDEPNADMGDPKNWKQGDQLECVKSWKCGTKGKIYKVGNFNRAGYSPRDEGVLAIPVSDDDGDNASVAHHYFRFHSRPTT